MRYHNVHRNDDDYHHRVFNWGTGDEVLYERLERHQFPTLGEVLDEVQAAYLAFEKVRLRRRSPVRIQLGG